MRWALLTCALTAAAYVTVAAPASASAAAAAAVAGAAAASSRQPIVQLMGRFSPGSTGQYAGLPQVSMAARATQIGQQHSGARQARAAAQRCAFEALRRVGRCGSSCFAGLCSEHAAPHWVCDARPRAKAGALGQCCLHHAAPYTPPA